MHAPLRGNDRIDRAGGNAQCAADASRLVDHCDQQRTMCAAGGIKRLDCIAGKCCQRSNYVGPSGRTPIDVGLAFGNRVCIRPAAVVTAARALRLRKDAVQSFGKWTRACGHVDRSERVLVTTLTKKMSEDLTDYLLEMGFRVRYLHSEVDTLERIQIIRDLRLGEYDVLVGVNLLREGLDLPEVSLVAILDADKEGFLRGETSLIQTIGRAARNVDGTVLMYADKRTAAMEAAIGETDRRRAIQLAYNEEHGITAASIVKGVSDIAEFLQAEGKTPKGKRRSERKRRRDLAPNELEKAMAALQASHASQLGMEYVPFPRVVALPTKPPLAITRTPLSPEAPSVIVPLIANVTGASSVLSKSCAVTLPVNGPATVRVSGLIVCPASDGVRTIDIELAGTPGIEKVPFAAVVALPTKPPLAVTTTPLIPEAPSTIVPLIAYVSSVLVKF